MGTENKDEVMLIIGGVTIRINKNTATTEDVFSAVYALGKTVDLLAEHSRNKPEGH